MPKCVDCGVTKATAEMRLTRSAAGTYRCRDRVPCERRVSAARANARAANLSSRNQRRVELAFTQLTALKDSVPADVWNADALSDVRESWTRLRSALADPKPKGESSGRATTTA